MRRSRPIALALLLAALAAAGLPLLGPAQQDVRQSARTAPAARDRRPTRLPWEEVASEDLPPGRPGEDYTPVVTPGLPALPFRVVEGWKVFHLVAEPVCHEVAPGLRINAWGFNGLMPGPTIEACRGDRLRIYVTNRLPAETAIHWHGIRLPNGQDGASTITQPPIRPGQTFVYEFTLPDSGTFMYHPHEDTMTQEGMGMAGMLIVHDRQRPADRVDRDFALMLQEFRVDVGTATINPLEMTDFNVLTINGRSMPGHVPLGAALGDRVRIRIGNLSPQDHHPIHLHGYSFRIVGTDGGWIPPAAQHPATTVLVQVGSAQVIELLADNPGDWPLHCHMTHHMMNQMGHDIPNMIGVDTSGLDERIARLIPGYMPMGRAGMQHGEGHGQMPVPRNSIPMKGPRHQFGPSNMGGMVTVFQVRRDLPPNANQPGVRIPPYDFPPGTVARPATAEELRRDAVGLPASLPAPTRPATPGPQADPHKH